MPGDYWDKMWIPKETAKKLANVCEAAGVPITIETSHTKWRIRPRPHTDLIVLAGLCDGLELQVFYAPGGDTDLGVVIFHGGKP